MRWKVSSPAFSFKFSVMLRLLRCRFWKSGPSRGPPGASPGSAVGGISILMTLAPQSASWRTQVGPERTRVRSRTVKRASACEALGNGILQLTEPEMAGSDIHRSSLCCLPVRIAGPGCLIALLSVPHVDFPALCCVDESGGRHEAARYYPDAGRIAGPDFDCGR